MKNLKTSILFLTIIILCLMSACSNRDKYESSTVSLDEQASEYMAVSVKEADKDAGTFEFLNCGNAVISYGDRNLLEKKVDDEWQGVVSYNQREMTEPSYELDPNDSVEYETEWDSLDEGDYRFVVPFTIVGEDASDTPQTHYVATYFTV